MKDSTKDKIIFFFGYRTAKLQGKAEHLSFATWINERHKIRRNIVETFFYNSLENFLQNLESYISFIV